MTKDQRDILALILNEAGDMYTVIGVEYPSFSDDNNASYPSGTCVKILTRQAESDQCDVDWINPEGSTVYSRSFMARTA